MPLHLKLRRGERLLVNGAVLEVGSRHGELLVHNHTNCLREGDLLHQEQATTPTRRVYFQVQMMIVDPDGRSGYRARFAELTVQLERALMNPQILERLAQVRAEVAADRHYRALALLRAVLKYEDMLLSRARLQAAQEAEREAYTMLAACPAAVAS
jgi:flagellar protein FlbT